MWSGVRTRPGFGHHLGFAHEGVAVKVLECVEDLGEKQTFRIIRVFDSHVLDSTLPVTAKMVIADTVLFRVDKLFQLSPKLGKLSRIECAFEHRLLDTLPVIDAVFGHLA